MTTNPTPELDQFESKLLTELRGVVDDNAARRPAPAPVRWRRPAIAVAASLGVLGLVTATMFNTTPAFAVEKDGDTITLSINRLESPEQLEAKLADMGIEARVEYTPAGTMCQPGRYREAGTGGQQSLQGGSAVTSSELQSGNTLEFPASLVKDGQTLVIETMWPDDNSWVLGFGVAEGEVGDCQPEPFSMPVPADIPDGESSHVVTVEGGGTPPSGFPTVEPTR